jgi:hypothetical protein
MKILFSKGGCLLQSKNTNILIDPTSDIRSTSDKQIIAFTNPVKHFEIPDKNIFVVDSEGRFEVGDFFVEGLYINEKRRAMSYYLSAENLKIIYLGADLEVNGEDIEKNLGEIDLVIIRLEDKSNLNLITNVASHYDPVKLIILLDQITKPQLEKTYKFFGKEKKDILENIRFKSRDIVRTEEGGAEQILLNKI